MSKKVASVVLIMIVAAFAAAFSIPAFAAEPKVAAHLNGPFGRIELLTLDEGKCEDLVHRENGHRLKGHEARVVMYDPNQTGNTGCW